MKKWIAIVCCVIVFVCCLNGCGSKPDVMEPSLDITVSTVDTQGDAFFVTPATYDMFYSLESFLDYAATAQSGDGLGDVASLGYFYLPTEIPDDYRLYRIAICPANIDFWYIPKEAFFEGSFPNAESRRISFISPRKHLTGVGGDNRLLWENGMDFLILDFPRDYQIENSDSFCKAEKFTRTADGRFVNEQGEDARNFTDWEEPVFSDAVEVTFLKADEHGSEFTFQFANPTDKIYAYSKGCRFEMLQGENWSPLDYGLNITQYDVGKLYPDWSTDVTYRVYHSNLVPGTYRIVLEFQPVEEGEPEMVNCEFAVE